MKKTKTLVAIVLAVLFVLTIGLAACQDPHVCGHVCPDCKKCQDPTCTDPVCAQKCTCGEEDDGVDPSKDQYLPFAKDTVLRMATGYNKANTGITFDAETAGEGITLADGKTYHTGELKPTWVEVEKRLGMKFEDKWTGAGSAEKEFVYWKDRLNEIDMIAGNVSKLTEAGVAGSLVDLSKHLDKMPNFKAYLDANPIVRLSITSATSGDKKGAIYFSPYFDGANDIERMPLMRADWVVELLDGEEDYTNSSARKVVTGYYTPYMPTSGKVTVDALDREGKTTQNITKDYDKTQNIIAQMNAVANLDGAAAVNMLRKYIKDMYGDVYAKPSDLFLGYDAAWDADELVALLRCVVANKNYTAGGQTLPVKGLYCRETGNLQRKVDLFRFGGTLFGVRGLESRQDYLYFDKDGTLHDARNEEATYVAIERMNQMYKEGLIYLNVQADSNNKESSTTMIPEGVGFMHYDYNQTQTALNSKFTEQKPGKYMAVMVPVARWNDGTGEKVMRFTESWRSVKTDGWALTVAGIGNDTNKLNAALKLIDYAYSAKGQILMSYGPDAFIKHDAQGNMVMFDFNGEQWPVISDETYAELQEKAGGNYTNYARFYLGSTLSFVKSQSFEYQCTHAVGREGAAKISAAIAKGTIKHPELAVKTDNMWYTSVPTTLPTTDAENTQINGFTELSSNGKFSQSKDKSNVLISMIAAGYSVENLGSRANTITKVTNDWNVGTYLTIKSTAWTRLLAYYNDLTK